MESILSELKGYCKPKTLSVSNGLQETPQNYLHKIDKYLSLIHRDFFRQFMLNQDVEIFLKQSLWEGKTDMLMATAYNKRSSYALYQSMSRVIK